MHTPFDNPFPASDNDRHSIWIMLVERDIEAFLAADWSMVAKDFIAEGFFGIDGCHTDNPDHWRLNFASLAAYRNEWLKQAVAFRQQEFSEDRRAALFGATLLRDIEINNDLALVHKKFDGGIKRANGTRDIMNWQTLYFCRRQAGVWKIIGFNGYLPNPMGQTSAKTRPGP